MYLAFNFSKTGYFRYDLEGQPIEVGHYQIKADTAIVAYQGFHGATAMNAYLFNPGRYCNIRLLYGDVDLTTNRRLMAATHMEVLAVFDCFQVMEKFIRTRKSFMPSNHRYNTELEDMLLREAGLL